MKILMVGCGAVGQVFGLGLQRAGVELAFYARPPSATKLRQALDQGGLLLFQTSRKHRWEPIARRLESYQVLTDVAGCQAFEPDQIWFATPSPVYYSEWFRDFLRLVPSRRVVCFAPEGGRPEFFPDSGPSDRLLFGGITFIAWQGALAGSATQPGSVTFWLPPLLEIPLMGAEIAGREVAVILGEAGFRPAVKKPDFRNSLAAVTAVITAFVAGFELAGWSFAAFRKSPWRKRAARAAQEVALSQLSEAGFVTRKLLAVVLSPAGFSLATRFLPLLFPFHLEDYLRFHYLKTRPQTLALLDVFIGDGERQGRPMENSRRLLQGLLD